MERIKLSDVAKYGVKNVKIVKPFNTEEYRKLVEEANARIEAAKIEDAKAWRRAKNFVARTSEVGKRKNLIR